jgi:Ca2+-binding EF-hand superfamily protein
LFQRIAKEEGPMTRIFLTASAAVLLLASTAPGPAFADPGSSTMNKQIRMMFDRFDSNGDGRICKEEFEAVHMIRFYTLDMDNDGEISREEFVFMRAMRGVPDHRAHEAFEKLDTDGNGRLSVEEFNASREASFAALDLNGDRVLSPSEVSQVVAAKGTP